MKMYKVIALYCSGAGKKMYRSGNIVPENAWPRGRADDLARRGFLVEIPGDDAIVYTAPATLGRIEVNTQLTAAPEALKPDNIDAPPAALEQLQVDEQDKAAKTPTLENVIAAYTTTDTTDVVDEKHPIVEPKKDYKDITIGQLKEYLAAHNIPFDENGGKKEWYKLYIAH